MSLTKSTIRRPLSLLASSSLALAGLLSIGPVGVILTPTAAQAYDECAPVPGTGTQTDGAGGAHDATLNGNAPDTFACTNLTSSSITYTSAGTTGLLTIEFISSDLAGNFLTAAGTYNSTGLRTNPGGDVVINFGANTFATANAPNFGLDVIVPTGTSTTVNMADNTVDDGPNTNAWIKGMRATGAGALVINNDGTLSGNIDLSALTGSSTFNITAQGAWYSGLQSVADFTPAAATTVLAEGDDTINVSEGGMVWAGAKTSFSSSATFTHMLDFRESAEDLDVFNNAGHLAINPNRQDGSTRPQDTGFAGVVTISALEEFHNVGVVLLGSVQRTTSQEDTVPEDLASDGWYDDVLSLPGVAWSGDGGEVVMNVDIVRSQTDCTTRNADGDLGAADCLMIAGGSTGGVTYLTINEIIPGDRGRYNLEGIVLVDVTGGTSAQGDFVVGPNSANYSPEFGGVLDKGVFFYPVVYNESTQQHVLYGLPGANAQQLPLLATAVQGLWRTSTGTWFERQADLRGEQHDGPGGGVWIRYSSESADRDAIQTVEAAGQTYALDNTLTQKSYAATVGADLLVGVGGDTAYVVGVMAGYAHADVEYEHSPNTARLDGWTAGAYASFVSGGFFLDAAVNANKLVMDDDVPALNLFPAGTILSTDLFSLGFQAEMGLRFEFGEGMFVEPLAGLSYVQTTFDEMDIPADDPGRPRILVNYDDPASFRGSLGGRAGWDQDHGGFRTQLSILGRLVEEFDGENNAILTNEGPEVLLSDDFSGRFTEVGIGAGVYSGGGAVSGFVNLGGKFGDDYQATAISAGVRVAF